MPQHPARRHAPAATRSAARTAQFQPAARARRFFCFFLKAARLRAVFLRFFSRMAVSCRLGELGECTVTSVDHRPAAPRRTTARTTAVANLPTLHVEVINSPLVAK